MNSRDITLWIDERWYDALTKHLKGKTLEEHLEDVIEEMCNKLPQQEYESKERKHRDTRRKTKAFRLAANCCLGESPICLSRRWMPDTK